MKIFVSKVYNSNRIFENDLKTLISNAILFLTGSDACRDTRQYVVPQIGVSDDRIAQHVDVYFYVDKELLVRKWRHSVSFFFFQIRLVYKKLLGGQYSFVRVL